MSLRPLFVALRSPRFLLPIYFAAVLCAALLQIALYCRPAPFGGPYVLNVRRYLPYAILYECYGTGIGLLPFAIAALWWRSAVGRRVLFVGATCVTAVLLAVGHINHELQRFMGIRLSAGFFATYAKRQLPPEAIVQSVAEDRGGAWLSILLLAIPLVLFPLLAVCLSKVRPNLSDRTKGLLVAGAIVGLFILPGLSWHFFASGMNRKDKVAPAIIAMARDVRAAIERPALDPMQIARDAAAFRKSWLAADASANWEIPRPDYPYWRVCRHPPLSRPRPNIILLILETFRAKNMRSMSPQSPEVPTPFLDALASSSDSAYWTRYYTNGVPTAYAMLALQTSVPPHSSQEVSTNFTGTRLDGFPGLLHSAGYHTAFFTAADPDWDNERFWLRRWFDQIYFDPRNKGRDRLVFRHAVKGIRALGNQHRPFFAIVQSISNHAPFQTPEPQFDEGGSDALHRINGTMRYTDDVVREFFTAISNAPELTNTIIVVTGDHGFDLGDRGEAGSLTNLRHETNWVPLIMYRRGGLPVHGRQEVIGSHIDLGPTLLDLAGVCVDMAAAGHSLLSEKPRDAWAITEKDGSIALETNDYSLFLPVGGVAQLYARADVLEQRDIAAGRRELTAALAQRARSLARLNDALLDSDHIEPH